MLDKSIPYYNIIMRYDGPTVVEKPVLPDGYRFSSYTEGDDNRWAQMEVDNNDFDTVENGIIYFHNKYISNYEKLKQRFIGVRNEDNVLVGSVICWDDEKNGNQVSTVHWLITDPNVQGNGIGTALVMMLLYKTSLLNLFPIYLHTQPWSYSAIGIYCKAGFRLLKTDSFRGYENQSKQAIPVLKELVSNHLFNKLIDEMI